jgi:hypothetical protein
MQQFKLLAYLPGYPKNRHSEVVIIADVQAGCEPWEHQIRLRSVLLDDRIELVNGLTGNQHEQLEAAICEALNLD